MTELREVGNNEWTHYQEPTEAEVNSALERILDMGDTEKYDAIIVDEGQDFRDEWWDLIEGIVVNNGTFYIFSDNNQTLLPRGKKYPFTEAPFKLSTNCRNAGEIFKLVARFHPQAPEPNKELIGRGVVRQFRFKDGEDIKNSVTNGLTDAIVNAGLSLQQITVLTTEYDPIENSVLFGMRLEINRQAVVLGKESDASSIRIPLYTVTSFKGLEADGIILFVRSPRDELDVYLYVGFSRARFLLNIIVNASAIPKIPQLQT